MKHYGGLAKVIELAGGNAVRIESNEWVEKHGTLEIGQVATTTGGNLDCKVLFHTVGPYWNGGSKNEESQVYCKNNRILSSN